MSYQIYTGFILLSQILLSLFLESLHIQAEDTVSSLKHFQGLPGECCTTVDKRPRWTWVCSHPCNIPQTMYLSASVFPSAKWEA